MQLIVQVTERFGVGLRVTLSIPYAEKSRDVLFELNLTCKGVYLASNSLYYVLNEACKTLVRKMFFIV